VYDPSDGKVVEKSNHAAAGDLLQLLVFYFELVHATIHILHYIMASALKLTSEVYPMLVGTLVQFVSFDSVKLSCCTMI
jgi:hypothetical protein